MVNSNKIFSSKPRQIARATLDISSTIFGNLTNLKILVLGNVDSAFNIGSNFEKIEVKEYRKEKNTILDYVDKRTGKINNSENFTSLLVNYDVILMGYKSDLKLIESKIAESILEKRKQKPVLFIDCGIPGNIDQDVGKINNCFLFDLNDLEQYFSFSESVFFQRNNSNSEDHFLEEGLNFYLSKFAKRMDLSSTQLSAFEKYLRLFFENSQNYFEKQSILKFLEFFKK